MRLLALVLLAPSVGCTGGTGGDVDAAIVVDGAAADATGDAAADAPAGTFTLTSPTITEGGTIPLAHVCAPAGSDTSPALAWTAPPATAMSFAVVFTDITNGLVHAVSYDIPSTLVGLPADVDKVYAPADVPGAHQTVSFRGGNNRGYAGPCPPSLHTYEFAVYAISDATLGATMATNRAGAVQLITMKSVGVARLTGTYGP